MKIYLTTYRNYNEDRPAAGWIDLDTYKDSEEFGRALYRIARDTLRDPDPEWMIQDTETDAGADWQAGLCNGDHLPLEYWTLKDEAAKEAAKPVKKSHKAKLLKAEQDALCRAWMTQHGYDPEHNGICDFAFFRKEHRYALLTGGEVVEVLRVPGIQTRFCCGEDDRGQGGEEYGTMAYALKENAAKHTEAGFWDANVGEFRQNMIAHVGRHAWRRSQGREHANGYTWQDNYTPALFDDSRGGYILDDRHNGGYHRTEQDIARPLTDEDFRRLRAVWMNEYENYKRRVRSYLKRFGTSKVHTWTFWTEA